MLVLGVGLTALGAIRCLGRRGVPLYVAGTTEDLVTHSRWYRALPGVDPRGFSETGLSTQLEALPTERMVLLPCTDSWAMAVSALPPSLAARFPSSVAPTHILKRLVDKSDFATTLEQMRLPHPRTTVLRDETALEAVPEESLRDYFLKPTRSRPFREKYRAKALRLQSHAEGRRIFSETRGMRCELMLQEFIPGPPTRHYFVEGFVDRSGHINAMLARQRIRMYPLEFGNSTATVSIPLSQVQAAADTLRRLLEGIGYRGVFSAEFKLDDRDGLFKILEVNARPWWFVEFAANCGVDVCDMTYRDALGEQVRNVAEYRVGRKCVYPRRELECRRALANGPDRVSLASIARFWLGAEQLTFCWDDPLPGGRELYKWGRSRLRQMLRR